MRGVLVEPPQLHFMCHTTATGTACGHFGAATAGAVWMSVARGMLLFVVGHSVWWLVGGLQAASAAAAGLLVAEPGIV